MAFEAARLDVQRVSDNLSASSELDVVEMKRRLLGPD
jgi:hypothetical protein